MLTKERTLEIELQATTLDISAIAGLLQASLGQALTAHLAGLADTRQVGRIGRGQHRPQPLTERRLREGYKAAGMLAKLEAAPRRRTARRLGARARRRPASFLREHDRGSYVDALLEEGDAETAWSVATEDPTWDPGGHRRARLAEARKAAHPDQALSAYMLLAEEELLDAGRRAYAQAIAMLKRAHRAAAAAGQEQWLSEQLATLREQHRCRPALIEMLDKAKLP